MKVKGGFMLINDLKKKRIVIYPAGVNGQLIQKILCQNGIKTEFFVDRAFESLSEINGISVFDPQKLESLTSHEYVVIIAANWNNQKDFFINNVRGINSELEILDGKELSRSLKKPICRARLNNNEMFDLIECENCGFERQHCEIVHAYLERVSGHKEIENDWRSTKFDWTGYITSKNCTLRCKHCCEMIPYLKDKGFVHVDAVINDVKKIAESSRFLKFVELIGGEPFLHPEIEKMVIGLLKIKNIGYIKSFTNGTVVPSDELCEIMKNPRFMLNVSNYEKTAKGKLLENIYKTQEKLMKYGIKYCYAENFEWLDFSDFALHNDNEEQLKKVFKNCFLLNCHRAYNGVLYRCPHQYAGIQLGELQKLPVECIDIHSINGKKLAISLEEFESVEYIDACKYCTLPFDAKPVPPGEQLEISVEMNVRC